MDFAPIMFELHTVTADRLKDGRGRSIPTVLAAPLDEAGREAVTTAGKRDEDVLLRAVEKHPGASSNELAKAVGWSMRDGKPYKVKVQRIAKRLENDGLITKHRGAWVLTAKGQKELNRLDGAQTPGTHHVPILPVLGPQKAH
jgi:hypothetical protein